MLESRDFVSDWKAFQASKIPSKGIQLPSLFFTTLQQLEKKVEEKDDAKRLRILELGCECGELSVFLSRERHHTVVGIDI